MSATKKLQICDRKVVGLDEIVNKSNVSDAYQQLLEAVKYEAKRPEYKIQLRLLVDASSDTLHMVKTYHNWAQTRDDVDVLHAETFAGSVLGGSTLSHREQTTGYEELDFGTRVLPGDVFNPLAMKLQQSASEGLQLAIDMSVTEADVRVAATVLAWLRQTVQTGDFDATAIDATQHPQGQYDAVFEASLEGFMVTRSLMKTWVCFASTQNERGFSMLVVGVWERESWVGDVERSVSNVWGVSRPQRHGDSAHPTCNITNAVVDAIVGLSEGPGRTVLPLMIVYYEKESEDQIRVGAKNHAAALVVDVADTGAVTCTLVDPYAYTVEHHRLLQEISAILSKSMHRSTRRAVTTHVVHGWQPAVGDFAETKSVENNCVTDVLWMMAFMECNPMASHVELTEFVNAAVPGINAVNQCQFLNTSPYFQDQRRREAWEPVIETVCRVSSRVFAVAVHYTAVAIQDITGVEMERFMMTPEMLHRHAKRRHFSMFL
jgi:hypothetical protein